jgi:hypothetical protein
MEPWYLIATPERRSSLVNILNGKNRACSARNAPLIGNDKIDLFRRRAILALFGGELDAIKVRVSCGRQS